MSFGIHNYWSSTLPRRLEPSEIKSCRVWRLISVSQNGNEKAQHEKHSAGTQRRQEKFHSAHPENCQEDAAKVIMATERIKVG
jgi:hypothetical protein